MWIEPNKGRTKSQPTAHEVPGHNTGPRGHYYAGTGEMSKTPPGLGHGTGASPSGQLISGAIATSREGCYTDSPMSPTSSLPRKQYLVDRVYQLRFVTRVLLIVFVVACLGALVASCLIWKSLYQPDEGIPTPLAVGLIAVATMLLIELLLAIPLVLILGIRQSHRIRGPMQRITRVLDAIGKGQFSQRISLREGDALDDVAKAINRMAEALQDRAREGRLEER